MRSRISIDLAEDNQPVIKIEYNESDDVRDKMVKRFMESFGGTSYFATFFFDNSVHDLTANRKAVIRPIKPEELKEHWNNMKVDSRVYEEGQEKINSSML